MMMKKMTAFVLAMLLALGCAGAIAESYTVDEKFFGQLQRNAVRGTVSFSVNGDGTSAMDAQLWAALKAFLPRLSVSLEHSLTRGDGQGVAQLLLDGTSLAESEVRYNETMMGFASDLLAGKDVFYTAPISWDYSRLLQAMAQQDNAWPPLWRVILAVETASDDWKERAESYRALYDTKLGAWVNSFASTTGGTENGVLYTELTCSIPAQAVKAQMKQLLIDFYEDEGLLALLREVLTAEEAAAYLQGGMRDTFFALIDQAQLSGNVEITRRYDTQGQALLDRVSLPFAADQAVSELTIESALTEAGEEWSLTARRQEGTFSLTCLAGEEGIYTGSLRFEPVTNTPFLMGTEVPEDAPIAPFDFDYNLNIETGEETYDLQTDTFQRTFRHTLLLKPGETSGAPTQSIDLATTFVSKSNERAATTMNAVLTWTDMETNASVSATLHANTAVTWAVDSVDALTESMRIDQLNGAGWQALTQRWTQHIASWLQQTMVQLIPASTSAPTAPSSTETPNG